jgi:PPK2 family polyphosphate:nucleotide phosphotransferase
MGGSHDMSARWRIGAGTAPQLAAIDTGDPAGAPGDKAATRDASAALRTELGDLQARLYAESRRSLLVVLQAMDAGGKDGTIRSVFSGVNPQGVRVASFKAPTEEELAHDFLWRVHAQCPRHGEIAIFNRSHYEDVLIVRVHELVPKAAWRARYKTIADFESGLVAAGTRVVKLFLHISKHEQARRLQERLDDPAKRWKFRMADLSERARWDDYQAAFEDALAKTSTAEAPWFVIPADHNWYRDWVVLSVLVETLRDMDPQYPPAAEDLTGVVID